MGRSVGRSVGWSVGRLVLGKAAPQLICSLGNILFFINCGPLLCSTLLLRVMDGWMGG